MVLRHEPSCHKSCRFDGSLWSELSLADFALFLLIILSGLTLSQVGYPYKITYRQKPNLTVKLSVKVIDGFPNHIRSMDSLTAVLKTTVQR